MIHHLSTRRKSDTVRTVVKVSLSCLQLFQKISVFMELVPKQSRTFQPKCSLHWWRAEEHNLHYGKNASHSFTTSVMTSSYLVLLPQSRKKKGACWLRSMLPWYRYNYSPPESCCWLRLYHSHQRYRCTRHICNKRRIACKHCSYSGVHCNNIVGEWSKSLFIWTAQGSIYPTHYSYDQ
jgi:hypothetical protein